MRSESPGPDFLYIGPDKCGSTWLFHVLSNHPNVFVPPCKDIYFFDRHYHLGLDWYLSFFEKAPRNAMSIGELSHDYLFSPLAAHAIAATFPKMKLLTCLRQPSERSFSHYLYMVRSGRTRLSFWRALRHFPELITNSRYDGHLAEYFDLFDRSQIKVLYYEDLTTDPRKFGATVQDFLDVPIVDVIDYDRLVRPASRPRNWLVARATKIGANLVRDMGYANIVGTVKHSRYTRLLYREYDRDDRPQMEPDVRMHLDEVFRPSIRRLEDMLDVDLSHWLHGRPEG